MHQGTLRFQDAGKSMFVDESEVVFGLVPTRLGAVQAGYAASAAGAGDVRKSARDGLQVIRSRTPSLSISQSVDLQELPLLGSPSHSRSSCTPHDCRRARVSAVSQRGTVFVTGPSFRFSQKLVSTNFSNFSAWHMRMRLLEREVSHGSVREVGGVRNNYDDERID